MEGGGFCRSLRWMRGFLLAEGFELLAPVLGLSRMFLQFTVLDFVRICFMALRLSSLMTRGPLT